MASTSASAQAADTCANAAYRTGASAKLPDCRAYEQASPADKNGTPISPAFPGTVSTDASRTQFSALTSIGLGDSVFLINPYTATRGTTAWSTVGMAAAQGDTQQAATGSSVQGFNAALTREMVVSRKKLTADAIEGNGNVYVRDVDNTSSYRLVASSPGTGPSSLYAGAVNGSSVLAAASPDFNHAAISTNESLLPNDPSDPLANTNRLYRWDGGALRLLGTTDNPTPTASPDLHRFSDDGERFTYLAKGGNVTALYQQRGDQPRQLISRSRRTNGDDQQAPVAVGAFAPSPSGTRVDFQTATPLLDSNTPVAGAYPTIYRWDSATDQLTDLLQGKLLNNDQLTRGQQIVYVSEDGDYIYFSSTAAFGNGVLGENNLYVLHVPDRRIDLVATLAPNDAASQLRHSPDGSRVAFLSVAQINGYDNTGPACPSGCGEVWTFDSSNPTQPPVCASCPPAGTTPTGNATFSPTDIGINNALSRAINDDGRVFFDTPQKLAASDANAVDDVYERDPGQAPQLLSQGATGNASTLADISPDGTSALFLTTDGLVPQDTDGVRDAYVARIGGGLASQQVRPSAATGCQGSECQGPAPSPAQRVTPGSATLLPLAPPRASVFKVAKPSGAALRGLVRSGRLAVSVRVGSAGRLKLRGRGRFGKRSKTVGTSSATAKQAGTVKLTLKLSSAARRELKSKGRLAVAVTVAFSKADDSSTIRFTIKQPRAGSTSKGGGR